MIYIGNNININVNNNNNIILIITIILMLIMKTLVIIIILQNNHPTNKSIELIELIYQYTIEYVIANNEKED